MWWNKAWILVVMLNLWPQIRPCPALGSFIFFRREGDYVMLVSWESAKFLWDRQSRWKEKWYEKKKEELKVNWKYEL